MKQIMSVEKFYTLTIKDGNRERYQTERYSYEWHYMEPERDRIEATTSYDEFVKARDCSTYRSRTKKDKSVYGERYSYFYTNWRRLKFSNVNFVSYEKTIKHYKESNYTLRQLMEKLPADEMMEYIKDKGLSVCPIVK